jgi:hypothetical protein
MNGTTGIAVGMATNVPPHNLNEVCTELIKLLDNEDISNAQLCRYVKGPDFPTGGQILNSADELKEIYRKVEANKSGQVASYIPQLSRVNPDQFAVSICTVDGQRFSLGDSEVEFCLQSVSKPINYCLALEEHGEALVHKHVGREPSGRGFNELTLNKEGLPHNPLINSGAIMSCSLVKPHSDIADRFENGQAFDDFFVWINGENFVTAAEESTNGFVAEFVAVVGGADDCDGFHGLIMV